MKSVRPVNTKILETPYLDVVASLVNQYDNMDTSEFEVLRQTRVGNSIANFSDKMVFDLKKGFPLVTAKYTNFLLIIAELLWFLEGGRKPNMQRGEIYGRMSNLRLKEIYKNYTGKDTFIWDGDEKNFSDKNMNKFSGDTGRIYGAQWRDWKSYKKISKSSYTLHAGSAEGQDLVVANEVGIDQLSKQIKLIKNDPYSRYQIVTAWNPAEIEDMSLPACHIMFQTFVRISKNGTKYVSLHMHQRSCDTFLGVPFNIASYALLTHMISNVVGGVPDELHIVLSDSHLYEKHIEQAREMVNRDPFESPQLEMVRKVNDIDDFKMEDFKLINYNYHPAIKAPLLTKNIIK